MHSIVIQAGWPIWLLILVSIAGLAIVIERSLSLQRLRIAPPELTNQVLQMVRANADQPEAIEKLRKSSALGQVLAEILSHRYLPANELRVVAEDAGRDVAFQLER
ncbi:MAG: MotA/TolQ/ExbB proton channel family protein, partial [Burkholderiales bacterium]|nr:MotA/TolQ/ExbB proton channel family protein [Burkholderiales bacterium]